MQSNSLRKEMPIVRQLKRQPYVTILSTFDPKMTPKYVLENNWRTLMEKIKNELFENYSFVGAKEVFDKLASIVSNLDYNTHKKSIAILVSAGEQKVYYRDVKVEDKFFVSTSFQYRDLVHYKKEEREYLLLALDARHASVYRGKGEILTRILLNTFEHKIERDTDGGVPNYSPIHIEKSGRAFLESVDRNLYLLLNAFPLPVFVLGSKEIISDYRRLTANSVAICNYIEAEIDHASEEDIEKIIVPVIRDWDKIKDTYLVQKLESAAEEGKIAVGVQDVWNLAKGKNVKHLIVEEEYEYHAYLGKGLIVCADDATSNSFIKDAIEDIIDKVLVDGGEIDLVSKNGLNDFMHIAAIQNY